MRYRVSLVLVVAGLSAAALLAGQETQSNTPANSSNKADHDRPVLQQRNPRYQVQNSDVLILDFPLVTEYDQTVTVQPDGYITLKDAGDVHVAGLTVPQSTEAIKQAYAKILHDPVLTVDLKDFQKPYFIALGEVGRPGQYDMRGDMTVTQALAIAGGLTTSSKHSQILVFHKVSADWVQVKELNLKKMLHSKDLSEDIHLFPGDMVFVPQNRISKIKPYIPGANVGTYVNPASF